MGILNGKTVKFFNCIESNANSVRLVDRAKQWRKKKTGGSSERENEISVKLTSRSLPQTSTRSDSASITECPFFSPKSSLCRKKKKQADNGSENKTQGFSTGCQVCLRQIWLSHDAIHCALGRVKRVQMNQKDAVFRFLGCSQVRFHRQHLLQSLLTDVGSQGGHQAKVSISRGVSQSTSVLLHRPRTGCLIGPQDPASLVAQVSQTSGCGKTELFPNAWLVSVSQIRRRLKSGDPEKGLVEGHPKVCSTYFYGTKPHFPFEEEEKKWTTSNDGKMDGKDVPKIVNFSRIVMPQR
ncbi:hypothetical protein CEXT_99471 [Caerostris extrusa]|uniref:THAP-type domain-containing protein n=1 Tax=Caerostris extrusa TaxID=172846 RepID=A0AAV4XKK7_CAEEX|nr:hypothetical protein CEXT_99471 [Caerostris extrusa]